MLHNYLFIHKPTGEKFLCEAADPMTAIEILELEGFKIGEIEYLGKMSCIEAEQSGLDVY